MKLRLRSIESKETLRVEVLDACTLSELKKIVCQRLPSSPVPASVRLSLNWKDDLQSNDEGSLLSLGIASGDLIFFSLGQPASGTDSISQNSVPPVADLTLKSESQRFECSTSLSVSNSLPEGSNSDSMVSDSGNGKTLDTGAEKSPTDMEVDGECDEIRGNSDGFSAVSVGKSFSVPGFLRNVFTEELSNDAGCDHKLIVIAVHAVMLETGFMSFDKNANEVFSGFRLRGGWPRSLYGFSLCYTLPECFDATTTNTASVVVKFQSLKNFMTIYGTLGSGSGKRGTHRVQLNEDQLSPFLNIVWADCGEAEVVNEIGEPVISPEKEVFKFWRIVKDNLALPLLIDLCAEAGLELPPCFMRLPSDLKLKILESLSGGDLARVSCVCLDLRHLASSDDLWKVKFSEEFGDGRKEAYGSWKEAFATLWSRRKSVKLESPYPAGPYWPLHRRRRQPNPFMVPRVPRIIGGDYDMFPPPFEDDMQQHHGLPDSASRRRFSPPCNLWVRGSRFI